MKFGITVGNTDRMIRYVVAAILVVAGIFFLGSPLDLVAYAVALILVVTGYTKVCALYSVLGINTLGKDKKAKK
ncbi:DUF2892 domain-containing protein [Candidatus Micrarchaeota archaeon]|nr:DUF2892 domain-containing protein [Candidatus Micrarchaeota archaeon]